MPGMRIIRQSDEDILDIAGNVQNASRIVQRVATVIVNQRTVNSILMDLHPVRSASVPVRKRTLLPSGAPAEQLAVGEILAESRNIGGENYSRKRNNRSAKIIALPNYWQRGTRSLFRRCTTSNSDAYRIPVIKYVLNTK